MKKLLILLLSAFSLTTFAQEKQVAILEPIAVTKEVTTIQRSMVRGEMVKAIGRQTGYAAFTRTDIDQIMSEHNFQQSGMVNDSTRKRLGEMQGVDYVCVTKITKEGNNFYLEANLVNIESGKISNPATAYGELEGGSLEKMLAACEKLAAELVGKRAQTTTSTYKAPTVTYSPSPSQATTTPAPKPAVQESEYVDLGLPSGTLWKKTNEGGTYSRFTYGEAYGRFRSKLPTYEQYIELKNNCVWSWTTQNGVKGQIGYGPNGNSIFFPAAGFQLDGGPTVDVEQWGDYWTSTSQGYGSANTFKFNSGGVSLSGARDNNKMSVRLIK